MKPTTRPGGSSEGITTRPKSKPRTKRRTIRLTPDAVRIVDDLRARFQQKFGRPPGPGDPMFFDAQVDAVDPIDQHRFDAAIISAMAAAGVDSGIIHAYRQTGRLLTEQNIGQWSRQERVQWQSMVEEYEDPDEVPSADRGLR